MEKRIFMKQMTPAEAGVTKTHEKYIRLPNDFDYRNFFQQEGDPTNNVIQIDFQAAYKGDEGKMIPLKFVYYANSNHEKRIPSLGPIFDEYGVDADKVVCLQSITDNGITRYSISFLSSDEIRLYTSPISYTVKEDLTPKSNTLIDKGHRNKQIIYYGAPGTGKSHTINVETKGKNVIRTTFHPDSDYSTFVGAYKPTTKESYVRDSTGHIVVDIEDGKKVTEDRIVYEFVGQAFLQAYISAWRLYAKAVDGAQPEEQYLVIEEINRGNCAQIFGDLFQLLDRKDNGFSEYPITADKDMQKHLAKAFAGMDIPNAAAIDDMYDEPGMSERIKNGEVLLFPSNLYIWATMNTSDQSLFPIDSAFKRRWEWKYMPIHNAEKNWRIAVNGSEYDWWQFLEKVNDYIGSTTNSEDKKLGYFFCKPKDGIITADTFVGKVIFYLWNDVFKDYGLDGDLFKGADGSALTFDKFYVADAKAIREDNVNQFLTNLGLQPVDSSSAPEESEDISNESQSLKDKYLNFWLGFNDSYEQSGEFKDAFTNPKGLAQTWLNIGGLNRSYYIALVVSGKNKVANVQLYFSKGEPVFDKYKEHFDEIKERFEQDNTTSVTLHEAQKNKYIQASIPFDMEHEDWNTAYNWFHEKAVLFKELCDEIDPKE
jgi:hypothetical protein